MKIIGIAGGSGAGKSTVGYALVDAEPEKFEIINLDDYQKLKTDKNLPMLHGWINWDHPDIIRWHDLLPDLDRLAAGKAVTIQVWSHRSNPDYQKHRQMIARTIHPRPVLIIEGYLALYNDRLNRRYLRKYYLDMDDEVRKARRNKNGIIADNNYEKQILIPMHEQFVEPTKTHADVVLDVSKMNAKEVQKKLRDDIASYTA